MALEAGQVIGGSYRIVRLLGEGGMGAVYEVEHTQLGVHYALKTFTLENGHVELFRNRFLAEGKVLARLEHPNIARVFDLDIVEDGNLAYFVMDLVHYKDGESYTLADIEVGGADEEHLARWFSQLASALDYIHDVGIVHRDIKLNNVLLNDKGGVTLGDFGISKFVGERIRSEVDVSKTIVSMAGRTVTGNLVMGTEGYMAPEILRGQDATAASDTYALGVTFFRLLTGMWYEPGTNAMRLLEPFDGVWAEILPRMLDADPENRPTSLRPIAERLQTELIAAGSPSVGGSSVGGKGRCLRISVKIAASVSGVVLLGVGVALFSVLHSRGNSGISYDRIYDIPACLE